MASQKDLRRLRIKRGIRKKIVGTENRPRLAVFRSNNEIYAQLIDDVSGKTLGSVSSQKVGDSKKPKIEVSKTVGSEVAKLALDKGIKEVTFDRAGYLYHGRVKALADGAREAGLNF